jgi:hypothetical protein
VNVPVVVTGDMLTVVASVLYVVATVRDTAVPQIVSWAAWGALLAESTIAEVDGWQLPTALYTGICGGACVVVTVLSLRRGTWVPTLLDKFSLAAVAAGLVLLLVVKSPAAVVLVTSAADLAAYLPTMKHAWQAPDDEPALPYLLFALGAGLTLYTADPTMVGVVYPFYLTAADTLVVAFIVLRRWQDRIDLARLFRPGTGIYGYGKEKDERRRNSGADGRADRHVQQRRQRRLRDEQPHRSDRGAA